jgi:hypothetical protein
MAFIDWLRKQHADSLRASQRLAADPYLRGMQPGANTAPAPQGAIPFQRTKPGFFARDYKKEDLVDNTLTVKNDGSETLVRKWKDPDQSALRVSGLGGSGGSHPIYQQPWAARKAYFDARGRNQGLRDMAMSQEEGLFRPPVPQGAVADPNPRPRGMKPSLANLGTPNILQQFLQGRQRIADRIERNRINRLMQFRTSNPYYGSGGTY